MNRYDELMTRCPRLGCDITFGYCRVERGDLPCSRLIDCWYPSIPVESWLAKELSPEQMGRFAGTAPKDHLSTLLEIAENLKKNR